MDAVNSSSSTNSYLDFDGLGQLKGQARKDAKPEKPGLAARHGRAYRDIYQLVREQLIAAQEQAATPEPVNDGYGGQDT